MPDEWASSGARLLFSMDTLIESEYCSKTQRDGELEFMGPNALRLSVLEDPSFVSKDGEEVIGVAEEGGWKLQMPKRKGAAGILRFWVDAEALVGDDIAAQRNDVVLR